MESIQLFQKRLQVALVEKYGLVPTARRLNQDLLLRFPEMKVLSDEAVRKWIVGKSIPNGQTLVFLSKFLGKDLSYWF